MKLLLKIITSSDNEEVERAYNELSRLFYIDHTSQKITEDGLITLFVFYTEERVKDVLWSEDSEGLIVQ